jgi:DNA repair exonuclease SbcCD ATPase subunit
MQSIKMNTMFILLVICAIAMTTACQKTYYNAWEKLGVHKRDIMVERVEKARDSQNDAKEQFQSALEQFSSQLNFKGGNLEEKYNTLRDAYEKSKTKAEEVSSRIAKVEDVSEALFEEWQDELQQYSNAKLRADSEKKLAETRIQYKKLIRAMKKAEERMKPVLTAFHDQVLYLKHNLNTQAILSLQSELVAVEEDIASLIREMEASIREADSFIRTMGK